MLYHRGEKGIIMNVITGILLLLALAGFIDAAAGNRLGIGSEIKAALESMGTLALYIVGMYSVIMSLTESGVLRPDLFPAWLDLPMIIGSLLPPDLGAFPLCTGFSANEMDGFFTGVIVSSCLGQFVGYQLPVVLSLFEEGQKPFIVRGYILGILPIPAGLLCGGLIMGIPVLRLFSYTGIIILICLCLALCFWKKTELTQRVFLILGTVIKLAAQAMFLVAVASLFFPKLGWLPRQTILFSLSLVLQMTIIVAGGLVLSKLLLSLCAGPLEKIGRALGTDRSGTVAILLHAVSSIIVAAQGRDIENNGLVISSAFAVSGAYMLGGQMAFIALLVPVRVLLSYFAAKLVCGAASVFLACFFNRKHDR